MQRGTLDGTKSGLTGSATRSQAWDLDALGNSDSVTTDAVAQAREHNAQNELTEMGGSTLTFDNNGNQTTDETGKTLVYDAWNRLVEARNGPGGGSLIRYEHDALSRRVHEGTTAVYYTAGWQVIEERNGSNAVTQQYVWSPVYIDALIERDRDTNADGTPDERMYVQQDANFNVTAITDSDGDVLERFQYDAYGARTVLDTGWLVTADAYGFMHGHQGGKIDAVTGYLYFRNRELNTTQMRWMQQDPIGYSENGNLYTAVSSSPLNTTDPSGLLPQWLERLLLGTAAHNHIFTAYRAMNIADTQNIWTNRAISTIAQENLQDATGILFRPDIAHLKTRNGCPGFFIYEIKSQGQAKLAAAEAAWYSYILRIAGTPAAPGTKGLRGTVQLVPQRLMFAWRPKVQYYITWTSPVDGAIEYRITQKNNDKNDRDRKKNEAPELEAPPVLVPVFPDKYPWHPDWKYEGTNLDRFLRWLAEQKINPPPYPGLGLTPVGSGDRVTR